MLCIKYVIEGTFYLKFCKFNLCMIDYDLQGVLVSLSHAFGKRTTRNFFSRNSILVSGFPESTFLNNLLIFQFLEFIVVFFTLLLLNCLLPFCFGLLNKFRFQFRSVVDNSLSLQYLPFLKCFF